MVIGEALRRVILIEDVQEVCNYNLLIWLSLLFSFGQLLEKLLPHLEAEHLHDGVVEEHLLQVCHVEQDVGELLPHPLHGHPVVEKAHS